jgi:hypothetical protein
LIRDRVITVLERWLAVPDLPRSSISPITTACQIRSMTEAVTDTD